MSFSSALLAAICIAMYRSSSAQLTECSSDPVAQSVNDFGFKLVKEIGGEGNMFISPLSIYTALALVYLGAGGRTALQFEQAFQLNSRTLTNRDFHENFGSLASSFRNSNDEYSLSLANAIFLQEGFILKRSYVDDATFYYGATLKNVNFFEEEVTKEEINDWAANNTQDKIQDFLKQPLDRNTVFALLNAIYFKGTWETAFNPEDNYRGSFYGSHLPKTRVTFMVHQEEDFRYFLDAETGYKFLELPYKGEHIAMLLAVPVERDSELDLEMTSSILCRVSNGLTSTKLGLVMVPKFKLQYEKELKDVLIELGIEDAFTNLANLTGMSRMGIFLSRVIHSAVIEVNEHGSEAAAVTRMSTFRTKIRPQFVANQPFLFYIVDQRSQTVLFAGRVVDPK